MINKDKIEYNKSIYWVPSRTNPRKIAITEKKNDELYVVQSGEQKFLANIEFIFNKQEHAMKSRKDWESYEKKRKKEEKAQKKAEKQKAEQK